MLKPIWHSRRGLIRSLIFAAGAVALSACSTVASTPPELMEHVEYKLGPGDQLRINVFGETDLTGTFTVGSQGSVAYPLVGSVPAAGKTIPEFTTTLQDALQQYVRSPNVSVEVANYRPFFILGEVQRPGTYPYSADLTVLNAVATAGGFTYRANQGTVFIRHANETSEHQVQITIATPILPGDTVRISERFF